MSDEAKKALDWLREHARFGCEVCGDDDPALAAHELRRIDGRLICEPCLDDCRFGADPLAPIERLPWWSELERFDPFAAIEAELDRIRREISGRTA